MTAATATRKTNPNAKTLSAMAKIARDLGREGRKTLKDTEAAHALYAKSNDDYQQEMRHIWVNEYMAGQLGVTNDEADLLRRAPRLGAKGPSTVKIDGDEYTLEPRDREQQQAYDRARKMFDFHIARTDKRGSAGKGQKINVKPAVYLALAPALEKVWVNVPGKTLDEQAAYLKAVIDKMVADEKAAAKAK